MTAGSTVLAIPRTPKSLNQLGARGNPRLFHREKKSWEEELALTMIAEGLPGWPKGPQLHRVDARAVLRFRSNRRRDEGNFRVLLEKALGDALRGHIGAWREGKWIPDDTPDHYSFKALEISPDLGPARTLITLEWKR